MDELFLAAYLRELAALLAGARIEKAYQYGPHDLAIRLWLRPRRATLVLSADPATPIIALVDEEPAERRQRWALLEAVRSRCVPGTLVSVDQVAGERIARLTVRTAAADHCLVAELIPRAPLLVLLDPESRIVAGCGAGLPGRRGLGTGKTYVAPAPPPAPREGVPAELHGLSPLTAREVQFRAERDHLPLAAARRRLEEEAGRHPAPRLVELPGGRLVPTPLVYHSLPDRARSFASFTELVARLYDEAVADRRHQAHRGRLGAALARRRERLERAHAHVLGAFARGAQADDDRRHGELLLAYQATARPQNGVVRVPDPDRPQALLAIPLLDPRRTALENAAAYFARYRESRRAGAAARQRLDRLALELGHLEELESALESAPAADLPALAEELEQEGMLGAGRARREQPAGRASRFRPGQALAPRRYRSPAGAEILVGRTSRGNDHLTFSIARPDDVWLHADGPGAHVVLRSRGSGEPDPEALAAAAALAAWFSRLRGAAKAEVMWTRRRHVRRIAGAPPGRVAVANRRSLLVSPLLAVELFGPAPAGEIVTR